MTKEEKEKAAGIEREKIVKRNSTAKRDFDIAM